MKQLRDKGDELKRENEKLLPIGLVDQNFFKRKMAQTASSGFGLKSKNNLNNDSNSFINHAAIAEKTTKKRKTSHR